jgi:alpha-beta hydrolase superfamily lysophospholipase
MDAWVERLWW